MEAADTGQADDGCATGYVGYPGRLKTPHETGRFASGPGRPGCRAKYDMSAEPIASPLVPVVPLVRPPQGRELPMPNLR